MVLKTSVTRDFWEGLIRLFCLVGQRAYPNKARLDENAPPDADEILDNLFREKGWQFWEWEEPQPVSASAGSPPAPDAIGWLRQGGSLPAQTPQTVGMFKYNRHGECLTVTGSPWLVAALELNEMLSLEAPKKAPKKTPRQTTQRAESLQARPWRTVQ